MGDPQEPVGEQSDDAVEMPESEEAKVAKFRMNFNRGAYSEREHDLFRMYGEDSIPIKNLEGRAVKKSPDLGSTGR